MNGYLCDEDRLWINLAYGIEEYFEVQINGLKNNWSRIELCLTLDANWTYEEMQKVISYCVLHNKHELVFDLHSRGYPLNGKIYANYMRTSEPITLGGTWSGLTTCDDKFWLLDRLIKAKSPWSSCLIEMAARFGKYKLREGSIPVAYSLFTQTKFGSGDMHKLAREFRRTGYIPEIEMINGRKVKYITKICLTTYKWAAYAGEISILECCQNLDANRVISYAIAGKQLKVLKWAKHNGLRLGPNNNMVIGMTSSMFRFCEDIKSSFCLMIHILKYSDLRILKWVVRNFKIITNFEDFDFPILLQKIVNYYQHDLPLKKIEFLIEFLKCDIDMTYWHIQRGDCKEVAQNKHNWTKTSLIENVIRSNNVKLFKYLFDRGIIDAKTPFHVCGYGTISREMFQICHEHLNLPLSAIYYIAIYTGNIATLEWLSSLNVDVDMDKVIDCAIGGKRINIIRWVIGTDWSIKRKFLSKLDKHGQDEVLLSLLGQFVSASVC